MSDRESKQEIYDRVTKTNRFYNVWADQEILYQYKMGQYQCNDFWSPAEIISVLDSPRYAGLKWRYFRSEEMQEFQKVVKCLPITTVLNYTKTLMRPIYTDFTETSENKEFSRIAGKFYYQLFMQESIYVSYRLLENAEIKMKDDVEPAKIEGIKANKYDLWVKLTDNEYDDSNEFLHLDTGITIKVQNWREHLAHCRWATDYQANFSNWFNIAAIELMLTNYFEQCIKLVGKRLEVTTDTDSEFALTRLEAILNNFSPIIEDNINSSTLIHPTKLMEGKDLDCIRDSVYYYLDRMKYEYGRVSNTNPKGERLTSGENYKDISSIANRQKETLEYLVYFAYQAEELWGQHLEFAVSGIPEKEAIYTVSHRAQNPNSEKEYFGQVEGTDDRVPLGKRSPKARKKNG